MIRRAILCGALVLGLLTGCGVDGQGGYGASLAEGSSVFAVLDLESGGVAFRSEIPDLALNPLYRSTQIVFRRVQMEGGEEVLMAVFELTQGQWRRLAGTTPWTQVPEAICSSTAHAEDHPAFNLDHLTVTCVLAGHSFPSGMHLDLPSDEEWTAACGVATGWWWGPTATQQDLDGHAVVRESVISIDRLAAGSGMDAGGPLAVATTSANNLGIHDMQGNVWEWTREGDHVRGGSWFDPASACRAEVRAGADVGLDQEVEHALIGARLVLRP